MKIGRLPGYFGTRRLRIDRERAVGRAVQRERGEVRCRYDLVPHALPDAALRGVPDASRREALLAARLHAGVGGVVHAEHELCPAFACRAEVGRGIHIEGQVAASMGFGELPVHIDRAHPIDGFEVQDEAVI